MKTTLTIFVSTIILTVANNSLALAENSCSQLFATTESVPQPNAQYLAALSSAINLYYHAFTARKESPTRASYFQQFQTSIHALESSLEHTNQSQQLYDDVYSNILLLLQQKGFVNNSAHFVDLSGILIAEIVGGHKTSFTYTTDTTNMTLKLTDVTSGVAQNIFIKMNPNEKISSYQMDGESFVVLTTNLGTFRYEIDYDKSSLKNKVQILIQKK